MKTKKVTTMKLMLMEYEEAMERPRLPKIYFALISFLIPRTTVLKKHILSCDKDVLCDKQLFA